MLRKKSAVAATQTITILKPGGGTTLVVKEWRVAHTSFKTILAKKYNLASGDGVRLLRNGELHLRPSPKTAQDFSFKFGANVTSTLWLQTNVTAEQLEKAINRDRLSELIQRSELASQQKTSFLDGMKKNLPIWEFVAAVLSIAVSAIEIANYVVPLIMNLR